MSELTEELEPLFDYRRVQPPTFLTIDDDDDDSSSPCRRSKRVKLSDDDKVKEVSEDKKEEIVHILDNDEEEEDEELDWLPPPPKIRCDSNMIEEDVTIKKLRLQKQQLESFAQSAKDVIRAVEEDLAKRTHDTDEHEREKIVISIQDNGGGLKQFRVYKDDKFEKLFRMYGDKNKVEIASLVFTFDGDKINPMLTPNCLGMEDDDIVEVHIKK
ncbi:uncharacterized protein LOC124933948 [Impatiens glandulifera]|uniref:uncharacterized protein LOC124933948 n=1 Tax=Impatiens glandulifera TaxID=253017 RepID=UPI001FB0ABF0|nr:uncharacterized protein LOC124933948 [Impatiens glandulifera]